LNKISAQKIEIQSLEKQNTIIKKLAQDYTLMLKSEERLFSFLEKAPCFNKQQENNLISSN
jgi:dsDNA-binding SOS-regulon protein